MTDNIEQLVDELKNSLENTSLSEDDVNRLTDMLDDFLDEYYTAIEESEDIEEDD